MTLKQLALAALCSGALMAPAFAQTPAAPKPVAPTAAPATPTTAATGPGKAASTAPSNSATTMTPAPATTTTAPVAATPQTGLTNINTASAVDLDKLPQIGKARRAAIIKGRPYKTTDDLVTKKVLSKGVFDKIKDKITV